MLFEYFKETLTQNRSLSSTKETLRAIARFVHAL